MAGPWDTLIDRLLQEAREAGKFDNLPNAGQPLKIEDDTHTPEDFRLAHKILHDNDLAPAWIMRGKDVERMIERLQQNIQQGWRAYQGALADAQRQADGARQKAADAAWQRACQTFAQAAAKINSEVLSYNLSVPAGIPHKPRFELHRTLDKLTES